MSKSLNSWDTPSIVTLKQSESKKNQIMMSYIMTNNILNNAHVELFNIFKNNQRKN